MKYPEWLDRELTAVSARLATREITRPEAVTRLRDVIIGSGDRPFMLSIASDFAARALAAAKGERRRDAVMEGQSEMFPDLPLRLFIRPAVAKAVILFTGHDWDTAKAMITNRTDGAIDAAKADRAAFEAAYARVRPLLSGDLTTADVLAELDGGQPAAVSS